MKVKLHNMKRVESKLGLNTTWLYKHTWRQTVDIIKATLGDMCVEEHRWATVECFQRHFVLMSQWPQWVQSHCHWTFRNHISIHVRYCPTPVMNENWKRCWSEGKPHATWTSWWNHLVFWCWKQWRPLLPWSSRARWGGGAPARVVGSSPHCCTPLLHRPLTGSQRSTAGDFFFLLPRLKWERGGRAQLSIMSE